MRRARAAALVALALSCAGSARTEVQSGGPGLLERIENAITELDVAGAGELLRRLSIETPKSQLERARLALYQGDCDGAAAVLSATDSEETAPLARLAQACSGAVAGSLVVQDEPRGMWLRLQEDDDRALAPFIFDVAASARDAVERDLGVVLPRPLRIDLVRDLFSLSAITGLPLSAAETTGTVAVARWGRVTMLSPRAAALGYPWEDTLAHELVHLALSRATRDQAPLWLQEGIAKRQEQRWREARPFDAEPAPDRVAHAALIRQKSIGIDRLGPSIAMLPTPEAATIAFAEVASFMDYWIEKNGKAALRLLLLDLKGLGSERAEKAMQSVTGYDLSAWKLFWQKHLLDELGQDAEPPVRRHGPLSPAAKLGVSELARHARLSDLLYYDGHAKEAAAELEPAREGASLRFRAARAFLAAGNDSAGIESLGTLADVEGLHGGWLALSGRLEAQRGRERAARAFALARSVDPFAVEAACAGSFIRRPVTPTTGTLLDKPDGISIRDWLLCQSAQRIPLDD